MYERGPGFRLKNAARLIKYELKEQDSPEEVVDSMPNPCPFKEKSGSHCGKNCPNSLNVFAINQAKIMLNQEARLTGRYSEEDISKAAHDYIDELKRTGEIDESECYPSRFQR